MTSRSQASGFSASREKPPCLGSISSRRWMVLASSPVCSPMRLAARPVGAASSTATPFARRIRRIVSRVEVLPTPGPPVITVSLAPSTRRTASPCEGESALPVFSGAEGSARSRSISGQGGVPRARRRSRSASDRRRRADRPGRCRPYRRRCPARPRRSPARRAGPCGSSRWARLPATWPAERDELRHRQGAMPRIGGGLQRGGDAGVQPLRRLRGQPKFHRDRVGGLEADAPDVPGQPVGILGHDRDGVGAVSLEDPYRPGRADAVGVQEQHDLAHSLLLGPAGHDLLGGALRPDPVHLDEGGRGSASMISKVPSPNNATIRLAMAGPMPRMCPEAR